MRTDESRFADHGVVTAMAPPQREPGPFDGMFTASGDAVVIRGGQVVEDDNDCASDEEGATK